MAANAVCCYPAGTPDNEHIYACRGHLYNQVKHCKPKLILAFGNTANRTLWMPPHQGVKANRGQWHSLGWFMGDELFGQPIDGRVGFIPVFTTYHPAAVLRNKTLTRVWREDLAAFAKVHDQAHFVSRTVK